jgi:hypothetical protein
VTKRRVVVNDKMQRGYAYYCTEPVGRNFDPRFAPELTPRQMLQLGVFGGKYMTDCRKEFPDGWFTRAKLCAERHDARLNYFRVSASQTLGQWWRNGWIHPQDPRGWFQVQSSEFRVQSSEFRVQSSEFRVQKSPEAES